MPETQGRARLPVRILILMSLTAIIFISGCIKVRDSPAPGCITYFPQQLTPIGGCFGKHVIQDVRLNPEIECLLVRPNNCNGGTFDIENNCEEEVTVEGHRIRPYRYEYSPGEFTHGDYSIEVIKTAEGYVVNKSRGNFATSPPEQDTTFNISGKVGEQIFSLTYVHTGPLC